MCIGAEFAAPSVTPCKRGRALSNLPVPHDTVEAGDFESDCFCPPPRRAGDLRAGGARPPWGMLGVGVRLPRCVVAWALRSCGCGVRAPTMEADLGVGA